MSNPGNTQSDALLENWEAFQQGKDISRKTRELVLRSWQRCRALGVNIDTPVYKSATRDILEKERRDNGPLLEAASEIMDRIFKAISGSGAIMTLASRNGLALHVIPDNDKTRAGLYSCEEYRGTCGIGTCLEEEKQVEIFGAEHYCRANHGLVCAAAPIICSGKLVGVLGISIPISNYQTHTLATLDAACHAISRQLTIRRVVAEQQTLLELLDEGIIALDSMGVIKSMNKSARKMLGMEETEHVGQSIRELFKFCSASQDLLSSRMSFGDVMATLTRKKDNVQIPVVISSALSRESDTLLVTLREMGKMRDFAIRTAGIKPTFHFDDIIASSPKMLDVLKDAKKVAMSASTVLICGESGTGKELFAQAIHNASPRSKKPFVAVNCGALPRELVQSELFGYAPGAFTGAGRYGNPGKFELADGGTIFLDEIGEMPLDAQVNLLRLLQSREVMRIGGKTTRYVDIRIIAATNRDLLQLIAEQRFREDLYYRLNVFPITLPPLRDRQKDLELLARHFIAKSAHVATKKVYGISKEVLAFFRTYRWPGNIRELENVIERAVYFCRGTQLEIGDIPKSVRTSCPYPSAENNDYERQKILDALERHDWKVEIAMYDLEMPRSTLYYKMKKYGLSKRKKDNDNLPTALNNLSECQIRSIIRLAEILQKKYR